MNPLAIHQLGRMLAAQGRGSDRHLVHVSDAELAKLQEWTGSGKINPTTGLMSFDSGDSGGNSGGGSSDSGGSAAGGGQGTGSDSGGAAAGGGGAGTDSAAGAATDAGGMNSATATGDVGASVSSEGFDAGVSGIGTGPAGDINSAVAGNFDSSPQNSVGVAQFDTANLSTFEGTLANIAASVFGGPVAGTVAGYAVNALEGQPVNAQSVMAGLPGVGAMLGLANLANEGLTAIGATPPGQTNPALAIESTQTGAEGGATLDQTLDPNPYATIGSSLGVSPTNTYLARGSP